MNRTREENAANVGGKELEKYLVSIYKTEDVKVIEINELGDEPEKANGYDTGIPLLIDVEISGIRDRIVLHTVPPDKFGNERRSDRAGNIILDFDSFNKLAKHTPALGMGAFTQTGEMKSLADTREFFLVTHFSPGRLFFEDLDRLLSGSKLLPEDRQRVLALAGYLAEVHATKCDRPGLYRRCIRDLMGYGKGVMSLIDSYPPDFEVAPPARLKAIEQRMLDWRWRLKHRTHRLSQVHGDFHPWNILFRKNNDFAVLGRSRGEWGEPADDVSALSIHFIFFSLQRHGSLRGVFRVLFDIFWDQYLKNKQDVEIYRVIQPFYAWRALALAHPGLYPDLNNEIREKLFVFIENLLEEDWFDPQKVNAFLG